MSFKEYIKDQWMAGLAFLGFLLLTEAFGILAQIPKFYLIFIGAGSMLFAFLLCCGQYYRKRQFFFDLNERVRDLDQAYLLPELVQKPDFLEGRLVFQAMQEMEQSMAQQICFYERNNKEYKEYIELWVHEVKLPIATGKLMVENNRQFYDESMMEELDKIDAYAEQALFYARSNYVEKDYVLKKLSLEQIVKEVIKKNKKALLDHKITIVLHGLEQEVYSDGKWLQFILQQILANSIKYMGDGERKLEWYAMYHQEQVKLYLKDSGIGIGAKDLPRVFEKGFTGENGRTGKKSTGIGLYLCKKLCEKMEHKINIVSSQGKGCMVIIRFPKGSMTEEVLS